jgi:hypothetical protein
VRARTDRHGFRVVSLLSLSALLSLSIRLPRGFLFAGENTE